MAAPIAEPYESLSDFKYYFLNAPNKEVALNEFWLKVNPNWSFWKITYNKDEGEGKVAFLTLNLLNGFLQYLDSARKNSFAGCGVYGVPGNYEIRGVWMFDMPNIPQSWHDLPAYENHTFEKLDDKNPEHIKLVQQYWLNTEEGSYVEDLPVCQTKYFR